MAGIQAFTDKTIRNLLFGKLSDPVTAGLSIEAKGDTRTWRYYRRVKGSGVLVRMSLGTYPAHTLPMARQWACGLNEQVEAGIDPRAAERAEKAAMMTVGDAHALYMTDIERGTRRVLKPRTLADKRLIWTHDMAPYIEDQRLNALTADELWTMVEAKALTAPVRANRLAAETKVFIGWCMSREAHRAGIRLSTDPSASLSAGHYAESKGRTRILSDEEIGWFLTAVSEDAPSYRRALTVMLLTGCRFSEVVEAPLTEYRDGIWTIPALRTKNATAHAIALGSWGRTVFENTHGVWLAPNQIGGLVDTRNWYRVRDRVHARMERLAGRPLDRWGFHDLRRTLRSNTFRLGIPYEVAEAMLNHARQGLERRYDVGDLSGLTRDGFAKWEAHVARIARAAGFDVPAKNAE